MSQRRVETKSDFAGRFCCDPNLGQMNMVCYEAVTISLRTVDTTPSPWITVRYLWETGGDWPGLGRAGAIWSCPNSSTSSSCESRFPVFESNTGYMGDAMKAWRESIQLQLHKGMK